LAAWGKQDWPAMEALVDHPPGDFAAAQRRMVTDLRLVTAEYRPGVVRLHGSAADISFKGHLIVGGLGPWDAAGVVHARYSAGQWRMEWSIGALDPAFSPGDHFVRERIWLTRAAILGAGGTPLIAASSNVSTALEGRAVTPELAAHVVGSVGAITAEQLNVLGQPYEAGDRVGQSGIEAVYERQLAGVPAGAVRIVDAGGRSVKTVVTFKGRAGSPVQTTIDLHTEQAAEAALSGVAKPAALVAIRASTGEILAVVSRPTAAPFDRALTGHYPPGSTFKVVTAAALLASGLTPQSPATCPPATTVEGRAFHNFEGETQAALPLHRAFAISCNTAFIGLSNALPAQALVTAAGTFGFGTAPQIGLPSFGGRVPVPVDDVEKVATAIGQARVEASPLMMAVVAAAVDAGTVNAPRLVAGAPADKVAAQPLDPVVVAGLRSMMAEVVASGTGTAAAVPGQQVYGKTGTAEFGTAKPLTTHAWFIGFRGDVAFAVLVEGGGVGGQVAAPLAAKFLHAL